MWNTNTTIAGNYFQEHTENLFDKNFFRIIDRSITKDPDLVIEYILTKEKFCVECKFNSNTPLNNKLHWTDRKHMSHYQSFAYYHNIPTFIVIGLEGMPTNPKRVFCIPLNKIRFCNLWMSFLEQYERKLNQKFFWKNGNLE